VKTVKELIAHPRWDAFIGDKLGNDLFINDPDRASRIYEAADDGCDGSTHQEHIDDWREFAEILRLEASRCAETDEEAARIDADYGALVADTDRAEKWHVENGTINQTGA
jgi:hypothetical protein